MCLGSTFILFSMVSNFVIDYFPKNILTSQPVGCMQSCSRWLLLARVAQFHAVLHPASYACHLHVVRICRLHADVICMQTSSACRRHPHADVIHKQTLSAHAHVIHTSSAALLMVSVDLNYLSTLTGTGY